MYKRKLLFTFIAIVAAALISCSVSFASQAIMDDYYEEYSHPSKFDNCLIIDGVDVSYWQKDIDWNAVKAHGVDFAFIRIGYTGLDSPFSRNADSYFEQNYSQAREAGVMVGVYYYSCATTMTEAKKEAQYVLDKLDGRQLDLPVVFDFEYAGRIKKNYESKAKTTSNILAFLNYITNNSDYEAMFYSYRNITDPTWNPKFNINMIDNLYPVWIAQYSTDISYDRPFRFWQYTSDGSVNGIEGRVDCNFWYYDHETEETAEDTKSIKNASVSLSRDSYLYNGTKKTPEVTVTYNDKVLTEGTHYRVNYLKNVLAGKGYVMVSGIGKYSNVQLVPFKIKRLNIAKNSAVSEIETQVCTGDPLRPSVKVYYKDTRLKRGVDYTVSYEENIFPGTASVTIKGIRNYYGSFTTTFEIFGEQEEPEYTGTTSFTKSAGSLPFLLDLETTSNGEKTYISSNEEIATVSPEGEVTLQGKTGTVYITLETAETVTYHPSSKRVKIRVIQDTAPVINEVENTALSLTTEADYGFIRLTWEKKSETPVDYFEVYRSTEKETLGEIIYYQTKYGSSTTFKDKQKLVRKSRYYYKVRGVRIIDGKKYYTKWSNLGSRYYKYTGTADIKRINGVEATKLKGSAVQGTGYVKLKWSKDSSYKVDYYQVYRSTSKSSGYKYLGRTESGRSYKNKTKLTYKAKYYYKVRGVRIIDGKKYYTKWSNIITKKYTNISTSKLKIAKGVKNTKVKASSTSRKGYIKIKWKKRSDYKVDYYQIYRSTKKTSGFKYYGKTDSGSKRTYKNTKNLKKGKTYYYKVRGVRKIDGKKYYTKWSNVTWKKAK